TYVVSPHAVALGTGKEVDIEGLAYEGPAGGPGSVYVVCSHSWKRKKVRPENSYEENLKALHKPPKSDRNRDRLCRFQLGADGATSDLEESSLRAFIDADPVLGQFGTMAGKENGVDFEGLSIRDGRLVVGCRGPVLRGGWTPAVRCQFAQPVGDAEVV